VDKLLVAREKYGIKTPVKITESCPTVLDDGFEPTITFTKSQLVDMIQAALTELENKPR
jgi:hypothetical protein